MLTSLSGAALPWLGSAAFALAAGACAWAAHCAGPDARWWRRLAVFHLVLVAEMQMNWRHAGRAAISPWLRATGLYAERTPLQWALVGLAAALLLAAAAAAWRAVSSGAARSALAAAAVAAGLFALEAISPHRSDALLYRPLAALPVVAWAWVAVGGATLVFAAAARRTAPALDRRRAEAATASRHTPC